MFFISDIVLYQLQISTNGSWENTVYPPTNWDIAQRRLQTYSTNFPEERYSILRVNVS